GEVIGIAKAQVIRNLIDSLIGSLEQFLGMLASETVHIVRKVLPYVLVEELAELGRTHVQLLSESAQRDAAAVVLIYICLDSGDQLLGAALLAPLDQLIDLQQEALHPVLELSNLIPGIRGQKPVHHIAPLLDILIQC